MKKLSIGIIIGLFLGLSTNAFAAIGDSVTAVFAKFTYVVNGETKTVEDPVLVYEGMSYLRTTQISNMLGYDVTYRADSRTIEFNKPETVVQPVIVEDGQAPSTESKTPTEVIAEPTDGKEVIAPTNGTPTEQVVEEIPTTPTETPTETPSEPVVEEPTVPDNTAACQSIRDSYASQIAGVGFTGENLGKQRAAVLQLEYSRDQALSSAGCN